MAVTHRQRGLGLLGRDGLGIREGLWLPVRSVHTIGMRFALDLVWLGRDGRVVRIDEAVCPGRVRTCLRARGVVEVAAGSGPQLAADLACPADEAVAAGASRAESLGAGAVGAQARCPGPSEAPDRDGMTSASGSRSSASSGRDRVAR